MYFGGGSPVSVGAFWYHGATDFRRECAGSVCQSCATSCLSVPLRHRHNRAKPVALQWIRLILVRPYQPTRRDIRCTVRGSPAPRHMGVIADTLRQSLRQMAESDARLYRGLAAELEGPTPSPALPATTAEIAAAIALLERHGFTVTR